MVINNTVGGINIRLNTARMDNNLRDAQKALNMQIVADCEPYIPFQQGQLRGSQRYPDGIYGGCIEWNTPYAHYMYEGKLYLAANGSSWAKKYETKYPSTRYLTYRQPGTGNEWFERAKNVHQSEWIALAKRKAGQG